MTYVTHRGYRGLVTSEDGYVLVRILDITDTVLVTCSMISEVQGAFEDLVDDYLRTCEIVGKVPG